MGQVPLVSGGSSSVRTPFSARSGELIAVVWGFQRHVCQEEYKADKLLRCENQFSSHMSEQMLAGLQLGVTVPVSG